MTALAGCFAADFPRWSCDQMFRLAADIERYPEFIPWCKSARVLSEDGGERVVDNHFGAGPVDMHFLTRSVAAQPHRLDIVASDGPFRSFRLIWTFTPAPGTGDGCRIEAEYELSLRSPILQGLARLMIGEVERRLLRNFEQRAAALYGSVGDRRSGLDHRASSVTHAGLVLCLASPDAALRPL